MVDSVEKAENLNLEIQDAGNQLMLFHLAISDTEKYLGHFNAGGLSDLHDAFVLYFPSLFAQRY